jgi:iron complex transport system substrate-binding protein
MKRSLLFLILAAFVLLSACSQTLPVPESATREFTDSTGRTVTVPTQITKIAITGPLTQVYVLPLAGDLLVGVSNAFSEDAALYLPTHIFALTEIGQLYGGKGEMDLEALLAAAPDVVIDVGEPKGSVAEDLDALTAQTGIPFIHISATVKTAPDAYRLLGQLLGREEQAEKLAAWCNSTYETMTALMENVDADNARKSILYCLGDKGVNVIAEGSFHAETVNMMANNLAVVEDVVSKGTGNEVDLEQILLWNPDVIIFAPDSCYASVGTEEQWQSVSAIADGNYFETPYGPYGWLSSPPSVQRYLGMLWLGELLYPDYTEYDLQEKVTEYYKLFYGCDLTDEMYQALMENALP